MKQNPLDQIMGVSEAAEKWNCTPDYVKQCCEKEMIPCVKIGKTWVLLKTQVKPTESKKKSPNR